jgi:hypothetical protein
LHLLQLSIYLSQLFVHIHAYTATICCSSESLFAASSELGQLFVYIHTHTHAICCKQRAMSTLRVHICTPFVVAARHLLQAASSVNSSSAVLNVRANNSTITVVTAAFHLFIFIQSLFYLLLCILVHDKMTKRETFVASGSCRRHVDLQLCAGNPGSVDRDFQSHIDCQGPKETCRVL